MRPGVCLTGRDLEVLRALSRLRVLTTEQVQRLAFPSTQTALRRLRRLEAASLLRCTATPGLKARLVTLTRSGLNTVAGFSDGARPRPMAVPSPFFLRHALAIADLRIALEESLRQRPDVQLLAFVSDRDRVGRESRRQPRSLLSFEVEAGGGAGRLRHLADAAFVLRRGNRTAAFLAEIDRGTEVVGDPRRGVGKAVCFYLQALRHGELRRLEAVLPGAAESKGFRLLFLTTSTRRCEGIRRRWGAPPFEPEIAKRFIWLATLDALQGSRLLRWPWASLDPADPTEYTMLPEDGA